MIFSQNNTRKGADILDLILEGVPMILCHFMQTFIGIFINCFPVKQNRKYNIQNLNLTSSSIIWLEIFYNEESSILCTIQPSEVVFRVVPERQLSKLSVHYELGYKSKNITAAVNFLCGEVDRTCLRCMPNIL